MWCKRIFLFSLFLFIIYSASVCSVGIGKYGSEGSLLFESGLEKTYKFYIFDSKKIHVGFEGDLAQYTVLNDPNPDGAPRNVELALTLPDYLEPGAHTLYVTATEIKSNVGASMGGVASVRTGVSVFSLYPGKYPQFQGVTVNDLNVNEKTNIGLIVTNGGEEQIENARGKIYIYDQQNQTIAILDTDSKSIDSFDTQTLTATFDSAMYNLTPGTYNAVGSVDYDGIEVNYTKEAGFILGELNVEIIDTTKNMIVNATNKYYITVQSDWAGDIDNAYAKITLPDGKTIKTPNIDLVKPGPGRKAAGTFEAYLETDQLSLGPHDLDIEVYYKGQTIAKKVTVNIIDGKAPLIEKPSIVTTANVLIGLSILVVLFIILYFLVLKKRNSGSDLSKPSDNDLKPPSF